MSVLVEERPTITALAVHREVQDALPHLSPEAEAGLGLVHASPVRLEVPGLEMHDMYIFDLTGYASGSFKLNGNAWAVQQYIYGRDGDPNVHRFYSGTAGNAGAALAAAAQARGRQAVLYAPSTLREPKRANMERFGGEVRVVSSPLVTTAIEHAMQAANDDPNGRFVHPFDDQHVVTGQGLIGKHIVRTLKADSVSKPVKQFVQVGGGSLLTSLASNGYNEGWKTYAVRPARMKDGELDVRYDGLAVTTQGSRGAAMLKDPSFVHGLEEVTPGDTGRAAIEALKTFRRIYEPSALVGVAALLRHAKGNPEPTTYVGVLSGRNAEASALSEFVDAAYEGPDAEPLYTVGVGRGTVVACGATALFSR